MYDIFWEDDDGVLYFMKDKEGIVWAHAIIRKWNKNSYYKAKAIWLEALEEFCKNKIPFICVYCPEENKKLAKFLQSFGFNSTLIENKYPVFYAETGVE